MMKNSPAYTGDDYTDSIAIFEAIRRGDKTLVLDYIACGYSPGQRNDAGNTELGYSIVCGQTGIASLLLKHGASPDTRGKDAQTALLLALRVNADENLIVEMIESGADVRARDKWSDSPLAVIKAEIKPLAHQAYWRMLDEGEKQLELHDIIRRGNVDVLKLLVEEDGVDIVTRRENLKPFVDTAEKRDAADYILQQQKEADEKAAYEGILRAIAEPTQKPLRRAPSISFKPKGP